MLAWQLTNIFLMNVRMPKMHFLLFIVHSRAINVFWSWRISFFKHAQRMVYWINWDYFWGIKHRMWVFWSRKGFLIFLLHFYHHFMELFSMKCHGQQKMRLDNHFLNGWAWLITVEISVCFWKMLIVSSCCFFLLEADKGAPRFIPLQILSFSQ